MLTFAIQIRSISLITYLRMVFLQPSISYKITNTSVLLIVSIFTNVNMIYGSVNLESPGKLINDITDCLPIFVNSSYMTVPNDRHTSSFYVRNYCIYNVESFMSRITNVNWCQVLQTNDTYISFNIFSDIFNQIYCDSFTFVNVKQRKKIKQG